MCDSATVYAENLSAVAQALMEAPLCLDDREERQEFSRRAAKMFDETNAFSERLRNSILDPLRTKLELFSAQEEGLSKRRELKVEFDSLMKEIREVRDSIKPVREKIMRRIVDASEMDLALRKKMPDEMARLKDLELRKSSLKSRLKNDTNMMTHVLSTMENQSTSLTRRIFSVVTQENKTLLEKSNRIFRSKKSTRRRETLTPRVISSSVRGVRERSARTSIISLFRVSGMSLKLQEYHSYRSFIPCKKITRKSGMHNRL